MSSLVLDLLVLAAVGGVLFWQYALPWLRQRVWWGALVARAWAIAGNSRTVFIAYIAELLAVLDEAQIVDWSSLFGVGRGGRIMAIMGAVIFVMRLITRGSVSFKPEA
jgi:hypothetical protein